MRLFVGMSLTHRYKAATFLFAIVKTWFFCHHQLTCIMRALFLLVLLVIIHFAVSLNNEPIIGILTQPDERDPSLTYLYASYVKWIER